MNIDVETFYQQFTSIQLLLEKISTLGGPFPAFDQYGYLTFDAKGAYYNTSDINGDNHESFCIFWEDINKPFEYFEEFARKWKEDKIQRETEAIMTGIEQNRKQDISKLKDLLNKYGIPNDYLPNTNADTSNKVNAQ